MTDNREHPRFPLDTTGTVILDTGFKIPFSVKDMSQRGAKILLSHATVLPKRFVVEIVSTDKTKLKRCNCSKQWQRGPMLGIRLLSSEMVHLQS